MRVLCKGEKHVQTGAHRGGLFPSHGSSSIQHGALELWRFLGCEPNHPTPDCATVSTTSTSCVSAESSPRCGLAELNICTGAADPCPGRGNPVRLRHPVQGKQSMAESLLEPGLGTALGGGKQLCLLLTAIK